MINIFKKETNNFPDFIIIGAQKSGTSSMFNYLNQSKYLQGSSIKEVHYFDKWQYKGKTQEWYKSHFKKEKGKVKKPLFFEATPNYIYNEQVALDIYKIKPNTKFIIILRDPVTRAFSAWNMYRQMFCDLTWRKKMEGGPVSKYLFEGRSEYPSFIEALEIEKALIKSGESNEPSIIRRGYYAEQLNKWFNVFPKENFLIHDFHDLKFDLNNVLKITYKFLEVPYLNTNEINKTPSNKRDYDYTMSDEEKKYLETLFQPHNKKLEDVLGYSLKW